MPGNDAVFIFSYGIFNAVKDTLTPKKIGIILFVFFMEHLILYGGLRLYWDVPNYIEQFKYLMDPNSKKFGVAANDFGLYYQTIIKNAVLVIYQAYTLYRKRKTAMDLSSEGNPA